MLSAPTQDSARLCSAARQLFLLYTFARAPAPHTGTETRRFILAAGFVDQWNWPHNRSDTYGNSSQMPKSLFTHNLSWLTRCPALAHSSWQRYHSAALNSKNKCHFILYHMFGKCKNVFSVCFDVGLLRAWCFFVFSEFQMNIFSFCSKQLESFEMC